MIELLPIVYVTFKLLGAFVIRGSDAIILNLKLTFILEFSWKYVGTEIDFILILKLSIFAICVFTAIHPGTPQDTFIKSFVLVFISLVISCNALFSSTTKNSSRLIELLAFSDNLYSSPGYNLYFSGSAPLNIFNLQFADKAE